MQLVSAQDRSSSTSHVHEISAAGNLPGGEELGGVCLTPWWRGASCGVAGVAAVRCKGGRLAAGATPGAGTPGRVRTGRGCAAAGCAPTWVGIESITSSEQGATRRHHMLHLSRRRKEWQTAAAYAAWPAGF